MSYPSASRQHGSFRYRVQNRFIIRSREDSKPRYLVIKLSDRFEKCASSASVFEMPSQSDRYMFAVCVYMHINPDYRRFVGCLIIVIHIRKWRLTACVVLVTPRRLFAMRNKACHPFKLNPYRYTQKISNTVVHL